MAFLAPVFAAVSTFLPIIGTGLSVIGALREGKQQENVAQFNAAQAERQASETRTRATINVQAAQTDADAKRRAGLRRVGAMEAAFGASGLSLAGTPTDALVDLAGELELGARLSEHEGDIARFEGETRAGALEGQAALQRAQGRDARSAGRTKAGATLLTSLAPGGSLGDVFDRGGDQPTRRPRRKPTPPPRPR